jgi:hypothetical protein
MEGQAGGTEHRGRDAHVFRIVIERAESAAVHRGVNGDQIEDCAMDFVGKKLKAAGIGGLAALAYDDEKLKLAVDKHARRFAYRVRCRCRKEVLDGDTTERREPTSKEAGPEKQTITAEIMECLLQPLPHLTPKQQEIYIRRLLHNERIVDMEADLGQSANSIGKAAFDLRARLKRIFEENGVTDAIVSDWLNYLDRSDG